MDQSCYLIVVAAGKGTRMGGSLPKQYMRLGNKQILRHTLDAFSSIKELCHICLVINPDDACYYQEAIHGYKLNGYDASEIVSICAGGQTRQQSVYNGLKFLGRSQSIKNNDIVLIHDAARPFITSQNIGSLFDVMQDHKGASLAYKITDTCRISNKSSVAKSNVPRDNLWGMQTPQAFHYGLIKQAHETCDPKKTYTDDTALVSEIGCDVVLVEGSKYNFKITTQDDMHMAKNLLLSEDEKKPVMLIRSGLGYDVHAFDNNVKGVKSIRLCGIDIKYDRKLKGHSDADVGIHALCDAIYGSISEGDIGLHFPSDNMSYKDMDSSVFLEHAMSLLRVKNGQLMNADITLICERPKIGPYREKMLKRLVQIMEISTSQLNIKATTTEELGFAGRKEGIAAQAIVSVSLPAGNKDE